MLVTLGVFAQETATVTGTLKDKNGVALENANIAIVGVAGTGTSSDENGKFTLTIPANQDVQLGITYVGYADIIKVFNLKAGETFNYAPAMNKGIDIGTYDHIEEGDRGSPMERIDPKLATNFVGPNESVEALLKTLPGVSSNNE